LAQAPALASAQWMTIDPGMEHAMRLQGVKGLAELATRSLELCGADERAEAMEFALERLDQNSMLSRQRSHGVATSSKDMLESMLSGLGA
jgi:hypothetical protein